MVERGRVERAKKEGESELEPCATEGGRYTTRLRVTPTVLLLLILFINLARKPILPQRSPLPLPLPLLILNQL